MKKLTDIQIDFLLDTFFEKPGYPGWRNIAEALLRLGKCVIAGDKCIWQGGVGNFIRTSRADGLFDCLEYKFDLESFLSAEWIKETLIDEIISFEMELKRQEDELSEIKNILI